jgi:YfiH family protein
MDDLLRFASLARLDHVHHGFAAADAFGAFDARRDADLLRLAGAVSPRARLVRTSQTHSANLRWIEAVSPQPTRRELEEGIDGLATAERGLALAALGADCPMLFLADRRARAVAVVHCGWRGVAGGIVDAALDLLAERAGCAPCDLDAAVAPGARGCCYEVGGEVLQALAAARIAVEGITRPFVRADGAVGRAVDLPRGIAARLAARGVEELRIELAPECTICGGERFHSHRRLGAAAGRMAGVIALAPRAR